VQSSPRAAAAGYAGGPPAGSADQVQPQPSETTREQENLPAEQPSAAQDPRFPPADAYACRPRDPRRSPSQGPRSPRGLSTSDLPRPATEFPRPAAVLPSPHRLRLRRDFGVATRRGRRAGSRSVVVHVATADTAAEPVAGPARVGFIVSRSCGSAVVRNRIRRQLRHLMADQLSSLPAGALVVVRALPAAASVGAAALREDLSRCLHRLATPVGIPS
jgi:ribonuclease P protein component